MQGLNQSVTILIFGFNKEIYFGISNFQFMQQFSFVLNNDFHSVYTLNDLLKFLYYALKI